MDMLFSRKRSMSIAARHKEQSAKSKEKDKGKEEPSGPSTKNSAATLRKAATVSGLSDKKVGKRKEALDQAFGGNGGGSAPRSKVQDKAPSLNVDIRNSLMMPGLSQRFSVLVPKLSTTSESSLRSYLASQRARQDGPSLTLEEEEMLFADIRDTTSPYSPQSDHWDGSAPSTADAWKSHSTDYLTRSNISTSTSSPSILSQSSGSTITRDRSQPGLNESTSPSQIASPPPTSSSFSSFQTFGAQQDQGIKAKSYGFSGRSQMRDETYLRKVSGKQHGSISSRKSGRPTRSTETSPEHSTIPLPTTEAHANAQAISNQAANLGASDETSTPASTFAIDGARSRKTSAGHSTSSSLSILPNSAPADTTQFGDNIGRQEKRAKRQSHLANLSPAQQKRISKALMEIDLKIRREQAADPFNQSPVVEEEEVLEPETETDDEADEEGLHPDRAKGNSRRPSYDSDGSFQSQHSAPFPYGISPARPEPGGQSVSIEPPSPSRLPPSPRSHNLKAQVEGTAEPIPPLNLARKLSVQTRLPEPILTPSKSQPAKHVPSPSMSSPSMVSPVPGYVPGQPRPIGSMHRSDGSISSRSATPTTQTGVEASTPNSLSYLRGHLRAGSTPTHPPAVTSRTSSLNRSRSVSQTTESRLEDDSPLKQLASQSSQSTRMLGDKETPSRRPSTNSRVSSNSPAMIQEESEDDLDQDERDHEDFPDIRQVSHRREMSQAAQNPQQHMEQARDALGWNLANNKGDSSRIVSHQGSIATSPSYDHMPASHLDEQREMAADDNETSDFEGEIDSEDIWGHLLGTGASSDDDQDKVETPSSAALSDALRQLSGLGQDDLAMLQGRLVEKAQAERQAIRDDSPTIAYSPALASDNLPKRSASLARGQTPVPPSSWRRPSIDRDVPTTAPLPTPPKSLAGIFAPPVTGERTQVLQTASAPSSSKRPTAAIPEPPLTSTQTPSVEGHDEMIHTPLSDQLSRNPSHVKEVNVNVREGKIALENDPEVRRDFEARIAAATAALNRPGTAGSGSKLERKPTKKGAITISSPKLVSSSTNVHTTPLTPPDASLDNKKKASEKSGHSSKSSGRWRKLGFGSKRGPSLSGQVPPEAPVPATPPIAATSPQLGLTPTTEKKLGDAINLPKGEAISPDLDNFKFPPVAGKQPQNPGIRDRPISPPMPYQPSMQQIADQISPSARGSTDRGFPDASVQSQVKTVDHSHTSSDSTVAKFIESGRALGLNPEQLDQMLQANGMLDRSATTASSRSIQSSAPTTNSLSNSGHSRTGSQSQPGRSQTPQSQTPAAPQKEAKPKGGGLFRSFSRAKKTTKAAETPSPVPHIQEPVESRNVVVRRTLLIPHPPALPTSDPHTPTNKSGPAFESPDSSRVFAGGRKQSIKRKPLNLTREDVELVSNSPPHSAHRRNFSTGSIHSNTLGEIPENQPGNKGLGFLHPLAGSSRNAYGTGSSFAGLNASPGSTGSKRRSSTGGSLYDLYGGDEDEVEGEEMLQSGTAGEGESQAVEICEYADGQVVWSLVNGMRDEEDDEQEYSFSSHSRGESFASNDSGGQNDSSQNWGERAGSFATPALNLRHRDRGGPPPVQRPETFVYRAASGDVADLIDHLSRDLDASRGRIDIRHLGLPNREPLATGSNTGQSSPFPYSTAHSNGDDETAHNSPDPRFADPPSPNPPRSLHRPTPPPPIFAPSRTAQVPAGGFSPKRQMMVRQGFAAHRANVSSGGQAQVQAQISPSGESFASSSSGGGQRTVEERLQNLLDRLKDQNDRQEAALQRSSKWDEARS